MVLTRCVSAYLLVLGIAGLSNGLLEELKAEKKFHTVDLQLPLENTQKSQHQVRFATPCNSFQVPTCFSYCMTR